MEPQQQVRDEGTVEDDGRPKPLDQNVRVLVFRAVRELLINVVKHARARKVHVAVWRADDDMGITVKDDGIGFDSSKIGSHVGGVGGCGLFSILERLDYLGGRLRMDSEPGRGTRVTLKVPLEKEVS